MTNPNFPPGDALDQWLDEFADGSRYGASDAKQESAIELHRMLGVAPATGPRLSRRRKLAIRQRILPKQAASSTPLRSSGAAGIVANPTGAMPLDRPWSFGRVVSMAAAALLMLVAVASVGLVLRLDDRGNLSGVSATASIMSFAPASALASQIPATPGSTPPDNYWPELVESVPVPGTNPNEVYVALRDPEDSYGPPPDGCSPDEVATIMVRFFDAWAVGDVETMERYLAPTYEREETSNPVVDQMVQAEPGYLGWFGINPIPGGIADGTGAGGYTVEEVIESAAARHEQNEVIQVLRIEYGSTWYETGIGMTFDLARDADDTPGHIIGGKGGIDCRSGRIEVLSATDQSPVVPEEWFQDVDPIVVQAED